jgi:hypothetical protein
MRDPGESRDGGGHSVAAPAAQVISVKSGYRVLHSLVLGDDDAPVPRQTTGSAGCAYSFEPNDYGWQVGTKDDAAKLLDRLAEIESTGLASWIENVLSCGISAPVN